MEKNNNKKFKKKILNIIGGMQSGEKNEFQNSSMESEIKQVHKEINKARKKIIDEYDFDIRDNSYYNDFIEKLRECINNFEKKFSKDNNDFLLDHEMLLKSFEIKINANEKIKSNKFDDALEIYFNFLENEAKTLDDGFMKFMIYGDIHYNIGNIYFKLLYYNKDIFSVSEQFRTSLQFFTFALELVTSGFKDLNNTTNNDKDILIKFIEARLFRGNYKLVELRQQYVILETAKAAEQKIFENMGLNNYIQNFQKLMRLVQPQTFNEKEYAQKILAIKDNLAEKLEELRKINKKPDSMLGANECRAVIRIIVQILR